MSITSPVTISIKTKNWITVKKITNPFPTFSLGSVASSTIVMIAIITNDSSSNQFATCLNIDSKTLRKENVNEMRTNIKNSIAWANAGMIPVRDTTIAIKNLIATN